MISVNCFGSHILYLIDFFHSLFFVKRGGDDCWVVPKLKWKAGSSQAGSYRLTTAFKGLSTLLDLMKGVNNESVARSKSNFCVQFPLAMIAVLRAASETVFIYNVLNYNFNRKVKSGKCQLCCCENASASLCSGFLFEPDSLVPTPSVVQVNHALHQPPFVLSAPPQPPHPPTP